MKHEINVLTFLYIYFQIFQNDRSLTVNKMFIIDNVFMSQLMNL
jgi:hypothetical protein